MASGKAKPSATTADPETYLLRGAAPIIRPGAIPIVRLDDPSGGVNADLLRGAKAIALEIYGDDGPAAVRRLYHEQNRWPIFRLEDDGVFYALRSRLRAYLLARSSEKEAQIDAAAQAEVKADRLKPRRRRVRSSAHKLV